MKKYSDWIHDNFVGEWLLYRAAFLIGALGIFFFHTLKLFIDGKPGLIAPDLLVNTGICFLLFGFSFVSDKIPRTRKFIYDLFIFGYSTHILWVYYREGYQSYYLGITLLGIQGLTFLLTQKRHILWYALWVNAFLWVGILLSGPSLETRVYIPTLFLFTTAVISLVQWKRLSDLEVIVETEANLRKSETKIKAMLESSEDFIWSIDKKYSLLYANNAYSKITQEIIGKVSAPGDIILSNLDLFSGKDIFLAKYAQAFLGQRVAFEYTLPDSAAGKYTFHVTMNPIMEAGEVTSVSVFAKDVTSLHQAQIDLLRSQERYAIAAKAFNDSLWEWDLQTNEVYLSPRWKSMIGYEEKELANSLQVWEQMLHPVDKKALLSAIVAHIQGHTEAISGEFRLIHKDGSEVWVMVKGFATRDKEGKAVRISGSNSDITDRKKAEESLKRLSLVASKTLNGVIITDARGIVEWVNEGFTAITGFQLDEVLGKKPGVFLQGPLTNPKTVAEMAEAIKHTMPFSVEILNYHKNGSTYWIRAMVTPVFNDQGVLDTFIAIQEDITSKKLAEEEYRKISLVASKTLSGVTISNSLGKVEWVNEGFEKMSGYTLAEIKGKRPGEFLHGAKTQESSKQNLRFAIQNNLSVTEEIINYRKNGEAYWTRLVLNPVFNESNNSYNYIAIQEDITLKKEAEAELLRAKEAAEAASQAKADFLANMSHEIRTPMNAVIGMTGLLLTTPLNEEQIDFVETIRNSGDNLLTIINDILDFSKIDAGKLELEEYSFNILDCVENVLDLFAGKANEKQIELMGDLESSLPRTIVSDPTRITQILSNLVSNAIKFTPENGEVLLRLRMLPPTESVGPQISFSISDTGIGIHKDKLSQLFQSFSQVDNSITRRFGGTGLGLAISRKLVELLGGQIEVTSEYGKGATFSFAIPYIQSFESDVEGELKDESLHGKEILIVDDNLTNLRIFDHQCRDWGLVPILVSDPMQAMGILHHHPNCQLVLLDMQMPGMSGVELAGLLKDSYPYRNLAMILISSVGVKLNEEYRRLFHSVGLKPMRRSQLLKSIQTALRDKTSTPSHSQISRTSDSTLDNFKNVRVLVAEDNVINQKVALRMLEKLGIRAEFASNGKEACEALALRPFDLILMDVQMPEMNGFEATRFIRNMKAISFQPTIIAMTANALKGDKELCLEAGMDDYLSKPVKLNELEALLLKWTTKQPLIT